MEENSRDFEIFLEIQRGLPRQGPGSDESTLEALSYCKELPENPHILDIGCGPGSQTITLANALNCKITALDLIDEYLAILRRHIEKSNLRDKIEVMQGDMNDLQFEEESFDLIWAEGSAYIMGFEKALNSWKRFLKLGGYVALSELVWLNQDSPSEVLQFFQNEYPPMTNIENNVSKVREAGYELVGHFTLPNSTWWDHYYAPLEAKLPQLSEKYSNDNEALNIIDRTKREIEMRRLFGDWYGYEFLIGQKI